MRLGCRDGLDFDRPLVATSVGAFGCDGDLITAVEGLIEALYTAVSGPVVEMVGVLALHATSGVSSLTSADNCTLVPAIMLDGAPSMATLGGGGVLLISIDTVATAGLSGNELFGSLAAKVKLSGPL